MDFGTIDMLFLPHPPHQNPQDECYREFLNHPVQPKIVHGNLSCVSMSNVVSVYGCESLYSRDW